MINRILRWFTLAHARYLWHQFKESRDDPNVKRSVLIVCLLSLGISVRMAVAARWLTTPPLIAHPYSASTVLTQAGNDFWANAGNPGALCLLFGTASIVTFLAHLEEWERVRLAGMSLMLLDWYYVWGKSLEQLGFGLSAFYLGGSVGVSLVFIAVYHADHDARTVREMRERETTEAAAAMGVLIETLADVPPNMGTPERVAAMEWSGLSK